MVCLAPVGSVRCTSAETSTRKMGSRKVEANAAEVDDDEGTAVML